MKLGFVVRTTLIHPATLINRFTPTFVFFILFRKLWHEFRIKCWNIPLVFLHYTFAWFWGVPRGLPVHIPWICNKSTIRECEFFWSPVKFFARQSFWITNVEPDFKYILWTIEKLWFVCSPLHHQVPLDPPLHILYWLQET